MTKRLIIHVGPHKTGTTAIQKMLFTISRFESPNIVYPFTDQDHQGQHDFATTIYKSDIHGLNALISKIDESQQTCVLSSEEFCYLPLDALNNFRFLLENIDVTVAYYARNCLTTLYPWWQEKVKHGTSQNFLEFIIGCLAQPGSIHLLVPDLMLSNWASAFGKNSIKIYLYDEIPDVAEQFASNLLGISLPSDFPTETNISYNYVKTEMIRFWNSLGARGSDLIQSPQTHGLAEDISECAHAFSKQFSLSYRIPDFAMIEETLLTRWRDQIVGAVEPHLFKLRERSYSYVHPDFWIARSDLAERMRMFACDASSEYGR
ncbi:hypothetical protein FV228_07240 [Methylobacterium sp. WL18]|uniref:hypothetical protein n=1 Tax=Methylobacterium sp. WL18 TaxID=2603897 RepID=UPI0011C83055|nr:hypothetical protein [Methylobacterium sp. WL18]TXN73847.1 hypothetical protein FV228_07240 [Methylobacterium sp. WL18]